MSNSVPNNVNIYQDTPNQVIVDQDAPNIVVVRSTSNTVMSSRRHVFTQASPSTEWVVVHNLGGKPSVTVVDSADTVVLGEVKYDSSTQVTISFTAAFSGYAYLT
jgi:hypothetical protein